MVKAIALLSPIYVTFFWGFVFLFQSGEQKHPKKYLGLFMILAFLLYCTHAIFFSKLYNLYSYFESLYLLTMLSIYPLYYVYILLRTTQNVKRRTLVKLFAPAVVFFVLSLSTNLFLSPDERILYVQDILINKNLKGINLSNLVGIKAHIFFAARMVFLVQVIYFALTAVREVNRHNKTVANYFSNLEGKTLNWIRDLNIVILFVAAASITFVFIGRSYFTRHEVSLLVPSFIFSTVLFVIGFKGNQQTEVLERIEEDEDMELEFEEVKTDFEDKLKDHLIELFENRKIYRHSDLRITTVSEAVGTNRTYISRFINDEFQMNFNEFVNSYRIQEAKDLLASENNKTYTIEHIAEKSGFGSPASFLRVFKATEGVTPGQYKKNTEARV